MIARIWRGETRREDATAYLEFLRATGVHDYRSTPGNAGVYVLRRDQGERSEFLLLTLWRDRDAVAAFAGEDIERARYYPDDARYLLGFPETVEHYQCLLAETAETT